MPDEPVELISPVSASSANSSSFSGIRGTGSSSLDKSDSAEDRATRLAELQEQVGADQVCSYTVLYQTSLVKQHQSATPNLFSQTAALVPLCFATYMFTDL